VVTLPLPPLRDRKEDIPLLCDRIIGRINRRQGRTVAGISQESLAVLMSHDYPGNIRELENIIEHAFILCTDEKMIMPAHLPEHLRPRPRDVCTVDTGTMKAAKRSVEAQAILDALHRNHFNRQAAARDLGIHKSTLFRKIKALGIDLPDTNGRSSHSA
jgi:transcriptional regulator with PAS, ATPase and Fis domain